MFSAATLEAEHAPPPGGIIVVPPIFFLLQDTIVSNKAVLKREIKDGGLFLIRIEFETASQILSQWTEQDRLSILYRGYSP